MNKFMYLIQGIFFTPDLVFGIKHDTGGARATISKGFNFSMYAGTIQFPQGQDPDDREDGEGMLQDHFGYSELTDVIMREDSLSFTKKYQNRSDSIGYEFEKVNGIWLGSYSGSATGTGASRCTIQPIDESFFLPEGLEEFLYPSEDLEM